MSIILKGIDMPKEGEMHLIISKNGIVCGAEYPCKIKHAYPLNLEAEAIQIPKGHGRLIDADKLRRGFSRTESGYCGYWEFCDKPEDMQFLIDDEPTILESEEADEHTDKRY